MRFNERSFERIEPSDKSPVSSISELAFFLENMRNSTIIMTK